MGGGHNRSQILAQPNQTVVPACVPGMAELGRALKVFVISVEDLRNERAPPSQVARPFARLLTCTL